jgi:hypothetical protein
MGIYKNNEAIKQTRKKRLKRERRNGRTKQINRQKKKLLEVHLLPEK